ncbi:transcriptional regulator [Kitasatospora sp. NPDC001261]|uniref:transcriptional regulator n=1 Tax=Kitasatospora sp. NPDC001261 TaxID=3364012 RepID=UPI0036B09147
MPAVPSGTLACPDTDARPRLAARLADMIPGAAAVIVGITDPMTQWPHAYARATDATGRPIRLSPVARRVVARWIVRAHPDADWTRPHLLDLADGQLAVRTDSPVRGR